MFHIGILTAKKTRVEDLLKIGVVWAVAPALHTEYVMYCTHAQCRVLLQRSNLSTPHTSAYSPILE